MKKLKQLKYNKITITDKIDNNNLILIYNQNIKAIIKINKLLKKVINKNEKNLPVSKYLRVIRLQRYYEQYLFIRKNDFNEKDIDSLVDNVNDSYYQLDQLIDDYNSLIDDINKYKKEKTMNRIREIQKEYDIKKVKVNTNVKVKSKENNINNGWNDLLSLFLLNKIFDSNKSHKTNNNYLFPFEQDEVDKGNYDLFNFEEEDLEDDDYYHDDDF